MTPQQYEARIRALEEKLADQTELTLWWKEQLCGPESRSISPALKLTGAEERIVLLLYRNAGRALSKEVILAGIKGPLDNMPDEKCVAVWMTKIRAKLREVDVEISTHWGLGYFIKKEAAKLLSTFIIEPPSHG